MGARSCAARARLSPCRPGPGAFAELVRIPARNVIPVPDGFDIVKAALAEPIAVGWHAARLGAGQLRRPLAAARCLVPGGGAIGLAAALVLRHFGARTVTVAEPNSLRRQTIRMAGDILPYAPGSPDEAADSTVDLVLDAVGANATRAAASRLVKPGGVIVHTGLLPGAEGLDIRKITLQEVTVLGTYCYSHLDFVETLAAMAAGHLGPLDWIDERPLSDGPSAFRSLDDGTVAAAKIVLRP